LVTQKKVLLAAIFLKQNLYSGIGTQRSGGRFRKAEQTRTFPVAFGFADYSVSRPSFDRSVRTEARFLWKPFSIADRNTKSLPPHPFNEIPAWI
jgi:hypothetical protein